MNLPRLSIYVDARRAAIYGNGHFSCNKGAIAHLAADRLHAHAIHPTSPIGHSYQAASFLSSYLYIASIDLLQWAPVARRLVLQRPLVYLELSLPRRIHIYVDALTHCNISRHIRIRGVIALGDG